MLGECIYYELFGFSTQTVAVFSRCAILDALIVNRFRIIISLIFTDIKRML